MRYVITNDRDQLVAGPFHWTIQAQQMMGLRGNMQAPACPYTHDGLTLRQVREPGLTALQQEGEGRLAGDDWVITASFKPLPDAQAAAVQDIIARRGEANASIQDPSLHDDYAAYQSALQHNWERCRVLVTAAIAATTEPELLAVWQDRDNGWA